MDTTKAITHISLCAGYGGIDLGLARAIPNLRTIAFSEIEAFACANLVAKMEAGLMDCAPVWTDLKTFPWDEFRGKVDILSGGFPCQPFSCAGKRDGDEDPRHLFPYILDGIGRCRPSIVFLENVEGILSAKLSGDYWRDPAGTPVLLHVLRELERVGYEATAGVFSASECGAPHQRKRVFIMAHDTNKRIQGCGAGWIKESRSYAWEALSVCSGNAGGGGVGLAHPLCDGSGESRELQQGANGAISISNGKSRGAWPSRPGQPQYEWEPPRVVASGFAGSRVGQAHPAQLFSNGGDHHTGGCERSESLPQSGDGCGEGRELGNPGIKGLEGTIQQSELLQGGLERSDENLGYTTEQGFPVSGGEPREIRQPGPEQESERPDEEMVNAELVLLSASRKHGAMGEQGEISAGKGSEFAQTSSESSFAREREDGWADASKCGETQPPLGGDSHGASRGMGYAELYTSCDNRTDELRLLGNGVVPATAELAFKTLAKELGIIQ